MNTRNEVELIGWLTCEPVFSSLPGGMPACKFIVETHDRTANSIKNTRHTVSCMGTVSDIVAKSGFVGRAASIRGRLEYWSDDRGTKVDIRANFVDFYKVSDE